MRILLVSAIPPPAGGIGTWTQKYLEYSPDYGLQVDLVNIAQIGSRRERINAKRNYFDEITRTFRIIRDMKRAVSFQKYDVVHINSSCSTFGIIRDAWCIKIAKKHRIPVILHCRCNVEDQIHRGWNSFQVFKIMVADSNVVIVLNQASYRYVESINPQQVVLIPNYIEEKYNDKAKLVHEQLKSILFVGHVGRSKGIFELMEAAREFPQIGFTVVGPISDEVSNTAIPKNVHLLGNLQSDEIKEHYLSADLFLFPSYSEGFSNAMLEAMASGLPIIATDVGSNRDMIEDGGGVIIPPRNSAEIVKAIKTMSDYNYRLMCSRWNREKVIAEYTIDKVMKRLCELYEELSTESRCGS